MKRRTLVVPALVALVLAMTAGWTVFAGDWPPEPYRMFAPEGAWIETNGFGIPGDISVLTLSPVDPASGRGSATKTQINVDPTCGGQIPEATSWSPWFLTTVRVGPDSGRIKGVCYVRKDEKPAPKILAILVAEMDSTIAAPDLMDYHGVWSVYSPESDRDNDGLPDAGETPLASFPMTGHYKRI